MNKDGGKIDEVRETFSNKLEDTVFSDVELEFRWDSECDDYLHIYIYTEKSFRPGEFDEFLDKMWEIDEEYHDKGMAIVYHIRDAVSEDDSHEWR